MASARGLGENIMGPQNARLPSPTTLSLYRRMVAGQFNDRVFVALCYDVFDPTTFINSVVHYADASAHMNENIILVPSFNPVM